MSFNLIFIVFLSTTSFSKEINHNTAVSDAKKNILIAKHLSKIGFSDAKFTNEDFVPNKDNFSVTFTEKVRLFEITYNRDTTFLLNQQMNPKKNVFCVSSANMQKFPVEIKPGMWCSTISFYKKIPQKCVLAKPYVTKNYTFNQFTHLYFGFDEKTAKDIQFVLLNSETKVDGKVYNVGTILESKGVGFGITSDEGGLEREFECDSYL